MSYSYQESIMNVIEYGGWTIFRDETDLLAPLRQSVLDIANFLFDQKETSQCELVIKKEYVSTLFDALNQSTELMQLQHTFCITHLKNIMKKPVAWTYPNIRVDIENRDKFSAPAHVDDWISFRGNRNIVVWAPLWGPGNIEISTFMGFFEVVEDSYWGVKMKYPQSVEWKKISLAQSDLLIFRDDLIHRSSLDYGVEGYRVSVQLRYEDLMSFSGDYRRAASQIISKEIKEKQLDLVKKGYYGNKRNI